MLNCLKKILKKSSENTKQNLSKPENSTEKKKKGYKFSTKSLRLLDQCDTDIKQIFIEVIKEIDCSIIEGHRSKNKQDMYFEQGASKLKWPNSKHNSFPSLAVDAVPYPLDWKDIPSFKRLMKVVKKKAKELKIPIRCGGDWIKFKDYPHYELRKK